MRQFEIYPDAVLRRYYQTQDPTLRVGASAPADFDRNLLRGNVRRAYARVRELFSNR